MTCQQREEYAAPVCEVLAFEVEEAINQSQPNAATPTFHTGSDASQEDDDF